MLKAIINKIDPNFLRTKLIARPSYIFHKEWAEPMFKIIWHWHIDFDLTASWWMNITQEHDKILSELSNSMGVKHGIRISIVWIPNMI